jgi:hypothetical protein
MEDTKKRRSRKAPSPSRIVNVPQELYDLAGNYESARAITAVAPIPYMTAQALLKGEPLVMTYENLKHIRKCLKQGINFSFTNKMHHIMSSKARGSFIDKVRVFAKFIADNPWITTPGGKLTKVYAYSETHIPLIGAMNELKKVDALLQRIHKAVPMYDEELFSGTGYIKQ